MGPGGPGGGVAPEGSSAGRAPGRCGPREELGLPLVVMEPPFRGTWERRLGANDPVPSRSSLELLPACGAPVPAAPSPPPFLGTLQDNLSRRFPMGR